MKTLIAAAIASVLILPCAALAQSSKAKQPQAEATSSKLLQRLDRNNDGFVTRDEAKDATELQGRFVELDTNNDGKISEAEMRAIDGERSSAAGRTAGTGPAVEAPRGGKSRER